PGTRARDGVIKADGRPAQQPSPRRRGEHPQPRTQERDRVRVAEQPVLRRPRRLERALQRDGLRREARSVLHSESWFAEGGSVATEYGPPVSSGETGSGRSP